MLRHFINPYYWTEEILNYNFIFCKTTYNPFSKKYYPLLVWQEN